MQDQSQAETDQQGIFDACFFMRFDDELKQSPIEQHSEQEHGRGDAEQRNKRIDLPECEHPKRAITAEHDQLAMGHVQNAEHAECQGQSGSGQSIEAADEQTEDELLGENHRSSIIRRKLRGAPSPIVSFPRTRESRFVPPKYHPTNLSNRDSVPRSAPACTPDSIS
jgi:hypothetical protein